MGRVDDFRPTLYGSLGKTRDYEVSVGNEKRAHLLAAAVIDNRLVRQAFNQVHSLTHTVNEMIGNMGFFRIDEREKFENVYADNRELLRSVHQDTIHVFPIAPIGTAATWHAFKYGKLWGVTAGYRHDITEVDFQLRIKENQERVKELLKHPELIKQPETTILTFGRGRQDTGKTLF